MIPPTIVCSLVRPNRVESETRYWQQYHQQQQPSVVVLPFDMLDGGISVKAAIQQVLVRFKEKWRLQNDPLSPLLVAKVHLTVYHTAAMFGPTENHRQTALDNVAGTENLVRALAAATDVNASSSNMIVMIKKPHLVMTSSMAAVRSTGQVPRAAQKNTITAAAAANNNNHSFYYTEQDWNTVSQLGANWGESYQWSKAESERRAWQLCRNLNPTFDMTALCPSFVFGPPPPLPLLVQSSSTSSSFTSNESWSSSSYSVNLVRQWIEGRSPVQSRLFVDVRDVAKAHVRVGQRLDDNDNIAKGQRYIVSTEARVPSQEIAGWLKTAFCCLQKPYSGERFINPDNIHYDATFQGGVIPIGHKEVHATQRLSTNLGLTLRPVQETIMEMALALLNELSSTL